MEKVEEVVALTLLADEYLISPLKDACAALIQNLATVENVWIILNAVSHLPKVAQKCSKVCLFKNNAYKIFSRLKFFADEQKEKHDIESDTHKSRHFAFSRLRPFKCQVSMM